MTARGDQDDAMEPVAPRFTPTPEAVEAVTDLELEWDDGRVVSLTEQHARAAIAAFVEAEGLGGDRAINFEPGRVRAAEAHANRLADRVAELERMVEYWKEARQRQEDQAMRNARRLQQAMDRIKELEDAKDNA